MRLHAVEVEWEGVGRRDVHPFDVPFIAELGVLRFDRSVTFLLGANGSGKSTLLEGLAVAIGLNAEGGSGNMAFSMTDRPSTSVLGRHLLVRHDPISPHRSFFLRAESFFNVATMVDRYNEGGGMSGYGDRSLHDQSHGESFLALAQHRFQPGGLYLLDEPEAALSFQGELRLLRVLHDLAGAGAQFVVATHSPVLAALPGAAIVECTEAGPRPTSYDDTELVAMHRTFLEAPARFLGPLLADD